MMPQAEVGRLDIVVDPAGLRFVSGDWPHGAGGASAAFYACYNMVNSGCAHGLKKKLTEVALASLRSYRSQGVSYWIIHATSPNFKSDEHDSRVPALNVLVASYLNSLRGFANGVKRGVGKVSRLPPLASGKNAGVNRKACVPEVTMSAR
eukprot:67162-Alexandrium_andersonii.AAC.1